MTSSPATPRDPVRLLTVCTGNVCRSPYAAALLADGLAWARPGAFEVTSAGTHALVGRPIDAGAERLLVGKGVSAPATPARMLAEDTLLGQTLVLVMSGAHRQVVLEKAPGVRSRTMGMIDLAAALARVGREYDWPDLLADAGAKEVRARWAALPEVLAAVGATPRKVGEVEDPYGQGPDAFERMSRQLDAAARTIVRWEAQFER